MSGGIYWLASYPKSGNTWFRAFLQNLLMDGEEPVPINALRTGSIASARGWIDDILGFDSADMPNDDLDRLRPEVYKWSLRSDELEYHKIHDAYTLTIDGEPLVSKEATKGAIYLVRNPLDVASSFANHMNSTVDQAIIRMGQKDMGFCRSEKRLTSQTRQKLFSWSGHVLSWLDAPGVNVEIVRYEDMLQDSFATFTRAAKFLKLSEDSGKVEKAIKFSNFKLLRKQEDEDGFNEKPPKTENFFRKGKSGGWRDELNGKQIKQVISDHGEVMHRLGYLDKAGDPV